MTVQTGSFSSSIMCPSCGDHMRFASHHGMREVDRKIFNCSCGFEYQQSAAAAAEHHRQISLGR
jgi:predicted RNA-binding Zn-ribbon protein involved in translation (DUF1610 family)